MAASKSKNKDGLVALEKTISAVVQVLQPPLSSLLTVEQNYEQTGGFGQKAIMTV